MFSLVLGIINFFIYHSNFLKANQTCRSYVTLERDIFHLNDWLDIPKLSNEVFCYQLARTGCSHTSIMIMRFCVIFCDISFWLSYREHISAMSVFVWKFPNLDSPGLRQLNEKFTHRKVAVNCLCLLYEFRYVWKHFINNNGGYIMYHRPPLCDPVLKSENQ